MRQQQYNQIFYEYATKYAEKRQFTQDSQQIPATKTLQESSKYIYMCMCFLFLFDTSGETFTTPQAKKNLNQLVISRSKNKK